MTREAPAAMLWAEFESAPVALAAARELRAHGFRELAAFTPHPVLELEDLLELERPRLILALTLGAAIAGGTLAFWLMWWTAARSYPLNVGGRPLNSFVTDIPVSYTHLTLPTKRIV